MQIFLHFTWLVLLILIGCAETEPTLGADTEPPLIVAAESGDISTLTRLLEAQATTDIRDACQWTPLMKAALNGHPDIVMQLLAAGASIDLTDKGGYSALMLAASNNHNEIVELLLKHDANVDQVENTAGWTALIWAAKQGHQESVQTLIKHQANTDIADFQGKRAVDWAKSGNFKTITSLLTPNSS